MGINGHIWAYGFIKFVYIIQNTLTHIAKMLDN